jgi:tRNA1Val (adenine37-N6)-methyltransferase
MANTYFKFKTFTIEQQNCAMKVTTDACLFGAWVADQLTNENQLLDIGAGTGLLSLMLAHKNDTAAITSVEIEETCFQQLSENIAQSIFARQIKAVQGNILDFNPLQSFDVIFSNPPFYEHQLKSNKLTNNQARHDASLSLNDLFHVVAKLLKDDGVFYVLLPFYRKEETLKLAGEVGLEIEKLTAVRQTPSHAPFRIMCKFKKGNHQPFENEITIASGNGDYTASFIELLKDFYINLGI